MAEKFEQKAPEIKPEEPKTKAEMKKEWREHFGVTAELQEKQEFVERMAKGKEEKRLRGRREHFGPMAELQEEAEKEKKEIESAKIPAEGRKPEQVLKEVGIEKPAESFEAFQKGLTKKLEGARTYKGERISEGDRLLMARREYLKELGYSVKYKGLLLDKVEIRDENNKPLLNEKGKPIEFKSFYFSKTERLVNDFLKDKLKEKLEGRPAKEMSEEEKQEAGFKKAVKAAENEQETRGGKISILQEAKEVGMRRLSKLFNGLAYIAGFDRMAAPVLKEGKKLAVEGGKDLMSVGLSPAVAVEEAGREISGRIQAGEALRRGILAERKVEMLEKIPAERRPEYWEKLLEGLKETSQKGTEEMIKGYDKMYKKGKILSFLEKFGGRFGRVMGERLEPKAY